jgi:diadenosine tetraphosphatase ApaH/serine/threonine PP2A family protein phosphatase
VRIAIIADVHANLEALEAVLRHAEEAKALDEVWCLGDTVGYGPDPSACLARLRSLAPRSVPGNHDLAAIGQLSTDDFNRVAAAAAHWTAGQLAPEHRQYLESLPHVIGQGDFTLAHGTLRWPIWEYLSSPEAAVAHFERQETPYSLVGHTHVPMLVAEDRDSAEGCQERYLEDGAVVSLGDRRLVVNPGGVGQPRDGDPRASYAVYDTDARTVTLHRLEYDIAATQAKMEAADLPRPLIERLSVGR